MGNEIIENVASGNHRPLRVMFANTSMPVGGAESLLVNLVRGMNRSEFQPEICCLKEKGPLGDILAREVPVHSRLVATKYDPRVWWRLRRLVRERAIDAMVTVGAGDKMFWGRLAAWRERVPVILSALHSMGWPDEIGLLNRSLTPLTDGFIAVAGGHARHLVERERFPAEKVHVIPNGVDVERFRPSVVKRQSVRTALGLPHDVPLVGIVAALREEKNHSLFVHAAKRIRDAVPEARFLIIGDGPCRGKIEMEVAAAGLENRVLMLGTRSDVPDLLATMDVFMLSSHMEANPVSILEAMATEIPVVAPRVGSIPETVQDDYTGYLVAPGAGHALAGQCVRLLTQRRLARQFGQRARRIVAQRWSLQHMVQAYERLIAEIHRKKCKTPPRTRARESAADALAERVADMEPVA
ncbi:MAG: glycosyltransferase [Planctomycetota bacterium]